MKHVRKALFWAHLAAGITAGVVIFIMSVTGVLLTYEKQLTALADKQIAAISPAPGAAPLPPAALLSSLRDGGISQRPSAVTLHSDANAPAEVSFGRERVLLLNPYNGKVIADGLPGLRSFFKKTRDFHRWLALTGANRDTGKAITGASNLLFLFLVTSGFYLWWPRKWSPSNLRNILWFRTGVRGKARDFNWHNTVGFWCTVPLFFVVVSGVVISYPWAGNLVYKLAGEQPPARRGGGDSERGKSQHKGEKPSDGKAESATAPASSELPNLNTWYARTTELHPHYRAISFAIPAGASDSVQFTVDAGTGGQPHKKTKVTFDPASEEAEKTERFGDSTLGARLRSYLRFTHTGEVLGIAGQTIAGIASAGAALLVYTGFALAIRRLRKRISG